MSQEYGTCECYACYRRVPKPEAHKITIEQERGRSSGSYSFGRRSVRFYSGRTYYTEKQIWLCDECYSAYLAKKATRQRRNVVAFAAVGSLLLIFGVFSQSGTSNPPRATRTESQSSVPSVAQTANVVRTETLKPPVGALPHDIARAQNRLISLGYMIGPADGVWGSKSRSALHAFKVANGLSDDDRWDSSVDDAIFSPSAARAPVPIAKHQ
jgi:Putative peptidoglycan binding domain